MPNAVFRASGWHLPRQFPPAELIQPNIGAYAIGIVGHSAKTGLHHFDQVRVQRVAEYLRSLSSAHTGLEHLDGLNGASVALEVQVDGAPWRWRLESALDVM